MVESVGDGEDVSRALAAAPTLSLICALGAWVAMVVQKALLPALNAHTEHAFLLKVGLCGEFGANLAAVAGMPALAMALHDYLLPNPVLSLRRRMLVAGFASITVGTTLFATFFDRSRTTSQMVFFGLGAAHVLSVVLVMGALAFARSTAERTIVVATAVMGLFGLMGHVLELFARTQLNLSPGVRWLHGLGEVGYLLALLAITATLAPTGSEGRGPAVRVRFATFLVLGVCGSTFVLAQRSLGADFSLILYHAQRLRLLLEVSPLLYAIPLSIVTASAIGALLSDHASQRQLAIGGLLLVAGGYLPQAPGQLLVMALGAALLSRAIVARGLPISPPGAA